MFKSLQNDASTVAVFNTKDFGWISLGPSMPVVCRPDFN